MANELFSAIEKEHIKHMEVFLKEVFCIDGSCTYIEDVNIVSSIPTVASMLFALGDTKRGLFYITLSK